MRPLRITESILFGTAVWLFWWLVFPQGLGYREQNQLFLFSLEYLSGRLAVPGGGADLISEFIMQFCRIPWLGAALMSLIFVALQVALRRLSGGHGYLSFLPPVLLLVLMGDIYVSFSFVVALAAIAWLSVICGNHPSPAFVFSAIPLSFWLFGPASWVFVAFAVIKGSRPAAWLYPVYAVALVYAAHFAVLQQYPWKQVLIGPGYYSIPLVCPTLMWVTAVSCVAVPVLAALERKFRRVTVLEYAIGTSVIVLVSFFGIRKTYDRDNYEILAYEQLIRAEKWQEVVARAEKYQPKIDVACVSVNLSLFMCGRFAELDKFYQCGTRGLLMPRVRDNVSNVSTGEAFWRLGFVNEALRYAFDTQESIPDRKKSPRAMMRMAECQIVNGRYEVASKYLDILKKSLFYHSWAVEHEKYLGNETLMEANPVYRYLRTVRNTDDYLFHYPEMDKMLVRLYLHCKDNNMAAWYYKAWQALKQLDDEDTKTDNGSGVHGS